MGISTDRAMRQQLIFLSLLVMLAALFTSRVALSIGMMAFLFFSCFHKNFLFQFSRFFKNPFLIGMALLFVIPLVTYFWSEDKDSWMRWNRIKLPLLLLPIGFAGSWQLTRHQWKIIAWSFMLIVFAGCCWSLFQYFSDFQQAQEGYLRAQILSTPLENDHVRFSLLVCLAVITATARFTLATIRWEKFFLIILLISFVIYLHVLSARTGLLGLYIFLVLFVVHLLLSAKRRRYSILILLVILTMPVAAWYLFPTFQNRLLYINYDLSHIRADKYLPGANDGSRLLSLRAGWDILIHHPFGVGSGDVVAKTNEWYASQEPVILESDRLYPSSEWLLYGAAAGWPGFLIFSFSMAIPFFVRRNAKNIFWIAISGILAFSYLFDIGLETQFGVFIHAFVLLCWWKYDKAGDGAWEDNGTNE